MSLIFEAQEKILKKFMPYAANTVFGKRYNFSSVKNYEDFLKYVPVTTFLDYEEYQEPMKQGAADLTWPGTVSKFAISAGTTGKPKDIPLTPDRVRSDKLFLRKVALSYLYSYPNIFSLWGRQLSLPGTLERDKKYPGVIFGEISGHLALMAPALLSKIQIMDPDESVWLSFKDKLEIAIEQGVKSDIRVITSLPSVLLRYFQQVLDYTGKSHIGDVWPNLTLLVSGGEPLPSYRQHLDVLTEGMRLHYIENYGASEGYFAFNTEQNRSDMKLVCDSNVFYEWIPNPSSSKEKLREQPTIPTWQVKAGERYGMVVTTNSGLWRYVLNDVVIFTDTEIPRIKVAGRASDVLDDYGEYIEAFHVQETLRKVTEITGGVFSNCTVGVLHDSAKESPYHVWFVQWAEEPKDPAQFAKLVDEKLAEINRSYEIRRNGEAIDKPKFYELTTKAIAEWQQEFMKVKAQTKFPRMIHDHEKCRSLVKRCRRMA
ncbi:MAG: GH3 auxin-responsive promoter family protein [Balneolales bacterium]|nr:GH3 auxin-responsive promoter family protein [Balneolales bacterium]